MKLRTSTIARRLLLGLSGLCLASVALSDSASAGELPKRKPGLWEIKVNMDGVPNMGPIQQCIDQNTDNLMQQKGKSECSVMEVNTSGNRTTVHAVCKTEGSTATTDGVFEGSLDTAYKGRMKTRFSPPFHGMSESNMTQEARWISPCKPGQKPGDVIMPNIGGINLNEMMNDPKVKELMKRQK